MLIDVLLRSCYLPPPEGIGEQDKKEKRTDLGLPKYLFQVNW